MPSAYPISPETLEELLQNWARWCHGALFVAQGVVMELDYEGTGEEAFDARRTPSPAPPRDPDGLMIERLLLRLPMLERAVLRVDYVYVRRRKTETYDQLIDRRRRRLKLPRWKYEEALRHAKGALASALRRRRA